MRTNIDIDEKLIGQAMALLGVETKKDAVDLALKRVLRDSNHMRAQKKLLKLEGIGWEGDLDDWRRD